MKDYNFDGLKRVSKTRAAALFNSGYEVLLIPHKTRPGNVWGIGCWITSDGENNFSDYVNSFSYYNCNNELGTYPAYYIRDYSKVLHDIYAHLLRGGSYGYYYTLRSGEVVFKDIIWIHPYKDYINWQHYGSSAMKNNIENLEWIISTIFEMTPDTFIKTYIKSEVLKK